MSSLIGGGVALIAVGIPARDDLFAVAGTLVLSVAVMICWQIVSVAAVLVG